MNILVIGNGFDLAHGLPTGYIDFLKWTVGQYKFFYFLKKQDAQITKPINNISLKVPEKVNGIEISQRVEHQEEVWKYINNNVWIEYFLPIYADRKKNGKDGWIDFESEISEVIQSLDDDMHGLSQIYNIEDIVNDLSNDFLREMYSDYIDAVQPINPVDNGFSEGISFKEIRDKLLKDLNRLIRAFEIYLTEYVEKIDIEIISQDIEEIAATIYDDCGQKGILFSKVISFNYTNIYEQIYLRKHDIDCNDYVDYIHGKANANNTIDTNNMVLGIDEYLGKKKRNKYVEFIAFKKFYQRIHKETGCKYKEWTDTIKGDFADYQIELEKSKTEKNIVNLKATVNKLKKQYLNKHNVYFFGHSLDVTDKDILRDLILNDNVHTTIFYHDKDTMGKQIANLVKIIGQDELIKRTGGKDKLIEFKPQKPMIERKVE
ncbi:AbiH family protein [Parablautia muri]|nr:AbiH family protein [Parablautia muri]